MTEYKAGDEIGIPCDVNPGPFSGEKLISLETVSGIVSGFVREPDLLTVADQSYVKAVVLSEEDDHLEVKIRGSFFTTNGLATVPRQTVLAA
jgi:hypothetical protein